MKNDFENSINNPEGQKKDSLNYKEMYLDYKLIGQFLEMIDQSSKDTGEESIVKMSEVLISDKDVLKHGGVILISCKSYTDLPRLDKNFFVNTSKSGGTFGSVISGEPDRGGFAAISVNDPDLQNNGINTEQMDAYSILGSQELIAPRDWTVDGDTVFLVTEKGIIVHNTLTRETETIKSPLIRSPHAITQLRNGDLCIAASGSDFILVYDTQEKRFTRNFCMGNWYANSTWNV